MRQIFEKLHISRLVALLMVALLLLPCIPAASAAEGSCGDGLNWSYSAGKLTITGSGDMTDFREETMSPWYDYREEITRVELPGGLTSIGQLAFYGCTALTSVVIPDSVERIGNYAFAGSAALTFVTMGSGVKSIGESAFENCTALTSLRLPSGLASIGFKAFYRCEGLTSVTIPVSVTYLGDSAFAYCAGLVQAKIYATVERIPQWLFYGCYDLASLTIGACVSGVDSDAFTLCDSLTSLECQGTAEFAEQIKADINAGREENIHISATPNTDTATNTTVRAEGEDTLVMESTTTVQTDNATVGSLTTDTYPADGSAGQTDVRIDATLDGQSGWEDVKTQIDNALAHGNGRVEEGNTAGSVAVNVYLTGDSALTQNVLERFAGQDVKLNIYAQDGSAWTIDCSQFVRGSVEGAVDLSYLLSAGEESVVAELGCLAAYRLNFNADAEINAQVAIQLPVGYARQTATLYQRIGGELELLQSVLVDDRGIASFWLAKVDGDVDYIVALSVPTVTSQDAIVPESLKTVYGINVEDSYPQYVITGRTSSWNMSFGQVMGILAAVMVVAVVVVGVVMFNMNKRRLKQGYVPEWDEEEE